MPAGRSLLISGVPTDYYAPDYKIEVEGQELSPATKGDILEIKVVMDKDNLTSFDLSLSNWDDERFTFKYSDTTQFDLGKRVHLQIGYAGELRSMVRGIVTTLTPRFPESGVPTLGVSGQDSMVRLKDRKPKEGEQKKFVNMADWEIARAIAARNHLKFQSTEQGPQHDLVVQKNQDDALFLMERAKRIDFDCYVLTDPASGEETLYFVRPTDGRDGRPIRVYEFEWGKSLINFSPTLTTKDQVGKVTVRGWDPHTKKAISYTAGPDDLPGASGGGTSGPRTAQDKLDDKQDLVVDEPVTSEQEARDLAISLLRERASRFNTGSGRVIGLPDLRPGDNVALKGLGKRFDGTYEVKKVEHTLGSAGYQTAFDVKRFFDGGTQ